MRCQLKSLILVMAVFVAGVGVSGTLVTPGTFVAAAGAASEGSVADTKLRITHVAPVAADVLGITVESGHIEYAKQIPCQKQDGDVFDDPQKPHTVWVKRKGQIIGALVGPKQDTLYTFDRLTGERLDTV